VTFAWWWIPAGLAAFSLLALLKPAHGPGWPFLLALPILAISGVFALVLPRSTGWVSVFLNNDAVFQVLMAVRFAAAILMIVLATERRIAAVPMAAAALLADPVLFNFSACLVGAPLCH
jgi:hypothetical protein